MEMPPSLQIPTKREDNMVVFLNLSIWRLTLEGYLKGSRCLHTDRGRDIEYP
jgi:hypothetical protein